MTTSSDSRERLQEAQAALAQLLFSGLEDNVAIMRHEPAIVRASRGAAPLLLRALVEVLEAGKDSAVEGSSEARALDAFVRGIRRAADEVVAAELESRLVDVPTEALSSGEDVLASIRQRTEEWAAEAGAAGPDATLLRSVAKEYEYQIEESLDPSDAARLRERAENLKRIAQQLDHSNGQA